MHAGMLGAVWYLCVQHHLGHAGGLQHPVRLLIGLLCGLGVCLEVFYDLLCDSGVQVGRHRDRHLRHCHAIKGLIDSAAASIH